MGRNAWLIVLASITSLLVIIGGVSAVPAQAANPSAGFDATNIIDDSLFYDGDAMSASQVQSFLNQQVPECWLGRPGYEVGKKVHWGVPTQLASKCTKDFTTQTQSRAANAYCAAYSGSTKETAANIVAKVGKACGISQRVLLITLQKEQSLITDPWPNEQQYFLAMGYACPDSGPGGTANCDTTQGGFFQQVYRAAWQLKVYKANPDSFNYRPFRNNTILYHPNQACGSSQVYIKNWATAALYIYTPYRPNQAALNAGWGTGDSCSSYGNRNFYNFYTSWFGSPRGVAVHATFDSYYQGLGGADSIFGYPVSPAQSVNGGLRQEFGGGTFFWSSVTGVSAVRGAIGNLYLSNGGPAGHLGFPKGVESGLPAGAKQEFEKGTIYYTGSTGAGSVNGAIKELYESHGGPNGFMGYPVGVEQRVSGAVKQEFANATVYYTGATGAASVHGAIRAKFEELGGVLSFLGVPIDEEIIEGNFIRQEFARGTAFYSGATGVSTVNGAIRTLYLENGGSGGYMGHPKGSEVISRGVVRQEFSNATAYYTGRTGAAALHGQMRDFYYEIGDIESYLGLPIGSSFGDSHFSGQEFERGTAYFSEATGAGAVNGAIRTWYVANGGP
ncbi:hypothetical protein ACFPII_10335, partial [Leucobacter denitrificans]